jgi:glycosyltransferase involved in cell wall biosynthesis
MPLKNGKTLIHLVPHGINSDLFRPLPKDDKALKAHRRKLFGDKEYEFVVFYNSRNIQRKRTSNLILAFRAFCDNLTPEQADKCVLLMHTEKVLEAGTDLPAVKEALCNKYNVIFDEAKCAPEEMNLNYNIADITVNITSNEGFGLSTAESIMSGTPIIVNVTGGLQDQIDQKCENGADFEFGITFGSNHTGKYKKHGIWAKPVWPTARYIQGSVPTPYIFDDICKWEDVAEAIMFWYLMTDEQREICGSEGRRWAMNEGGINHKNLAAQFKLGAKYVFDNFVPSNHFSIHTAEEFRGQRPPFDSIGGEIPVIDKAKIQEELIRLGHNHAVK